jgi:hypothetical protein
LPLNPSNFFCLETKKVAKNNSRKKHASARVPCPAFAGPHFFRACAQVASLEEISDLDYARHIILLKFRYSMTILQLQQDGMVFQFA